MKQKQAFFLGIVVVIALLLVVQAILFLKPIPGNGKRIAHVRFKNIEKVGPGTRVTFAGRPIGVVEEIQTRTSDLEGRETLDHGQLYPYELILRLDSSIQLFPQDIITIHTAGLMGEKSIAIIPKPVQNAQESKPLLPNAVLYGIEPETVEETLAVLTNVLKTTKETVTKMEETIDTNKETLSSVMNEMNRFFATLNNEKLVVKLTALADVGTTCLKKYDTLAETCMNGPGAMSRLLTQTSMGDNLEEVVFKTNRLLDAMREHGLFFTFSSAYKRTLAQERAAMQNQHKELQSLTRTLIQTKSTLQEAPEKDRHQEIIDSLDATLRLLSKQEPKNHNP